MATLRTLRPRPLLAHLPQRLPHLLKPSATTTAAASITQTRPFLSSLPSIPGLTTSTPQTLHARRTLPYPPAFLYAIIADIDAYRHFLPYCTASRVHASTTPVAPDTRGHPALASLTVGWGPLTESYTSRVYCVPGRMVEAVSGDAETGIDRDVLREVGYAMDDGGRTKTAGKGEVAGLFESLVTRWTVEPVDETTWETLEGADRTDVRLDIRYRFANPAYGLAVGKVADEVAGLMVEAFEKRARELYRP